VIRPGLLHAVSVLARVGSVGVAATLLSTHDGLEEETANELAAEALTTLIGISPQGMSFHKSCALYNLRLLLNDALTGEHPSPSQALDVQKEINRLLADT